MRSISNVGLGNRSAWLIGIVALVLMAGAAVPSIAQERLEQDFGIIRACAGDVWRLCASWLPLSARTCMQDKMGQLSKGCLDKLLEKMASSSFKVCKDQTYALCAAARCNVYDGVAYCQCEEKHGNSISLPFPMGKNRDVCSINAAGANNKYMVSTYSLPEQIASPQGGGAAYTCASETSDGAYAQMRWRIVLHEHRGDDVPGLRQARTEGPNHLFLPHH